MHLVCESVFEQIWTTGIEQVNMHLGSESLRLALQFLSKSEPLMMGDHIQAVSYSSVFEQVWTTDKNKHHLGCEWLSSV